MSETPEEIEGVKARLRELGDGAIGPLVAVGIGMGATDNDLCFSVEGSKGGGTLIFADGFESGTAGSWAEGAY